MEINDESKSSLGRSKSSDSPKRRRVGLIYDDRMCLHATPDEESHPENPNRIRVIWDILNSSGVAQRCVVLNASEAADKYLALVHTENHINLIKNIIPRNSESRRKRIASKFNSIYFNKGSSEAAYLAAGSVIEVAEKVAKGELDSAFAIVRPPGHHAEEDEPMGFCLYNNVAVATSLLLNERPELGIKKVLIVDWDVHHGNGTQKMFYKDPRVLFFSVHRHEYGTFYPTGEDGSYVMIGEGPGEGYNINVPWENGRCGDADYLAVWDHILIPVAKEFNPDIVIISAGFDAAIGDPLGGCRVSPYGYSILLDKLMEFAGGKIVMALEGGYNLNSLANSVHACVEVLLQQKPVTGSLEAYPFESTWRVIQAVRQELCGHWPFLVAKLPSTIISRTTSLIEISSSDSDGELEENEALEDVIKPFTNLTAPPSGQALVSSNKLAQALARFAGGRAIPMRSTSATSQSAASDSSNVPVFSSTELENLRKEFSNYQGQPLESLMVHKGPTLDRLMRKLSSVNLPLDNSSFYSTFARQFHQMRNDFKDNDCALKAQASYESPVEELTRQFNELYAQGSRIEESLHHLTAVEAELVSAIEKLQLELADVRARLQETVAECDSIADQLSNANALLDEAANTEAQLTAKAEVASADQARIEIALKEFLGKFIQDFLS